MTTFSANLGFLWRDRALPDAIRRAAAAGFDAVECHWPYDIPAEDVARALGETGLPMLGLNTRTGRPSEMGLAALPGREAEARAEIDRAIAYARAIGCGAVHVMAGCAEGAEARQAFLTNLDHACRAAPDLTVLIEALNHHDAPGYFLSRSDQAAGLIEAAGHANLRMMFDCYHIQISEGDVTRRLRRHLPIIGHVQIAAVPDRTAPDHGELDYRHICATLADLGWARPLGAEYRPRGDDSDLGWMDLLRAI
jgi:hydroxypyruvate isomerase